MAASSAEAEQRRQLRQYRVFYDLNERQTAGHETYFEDIQTLGGYNLDEYKSNITIESRKKPWRQNILSRAKTISAKARRCLEANKNKTSWRLSVESEILARFSIEVVCSECCARLWRSELEVPLTTSDGRVEDLAQRQMNRQNCQCPSRNRGEDQIDEGLNPLFDDRADEEIEHTDEIEAFLKKGKRPDRLIGLRVTKRLRRVLYETEGPEGDLIVDSLKTSPFKDSCEPLLFPFLVLEAKSEKSADTFSKINLQTGFAIRSLLELQCNLKQATSDNQTCGIQPLVWFLSYKGEIWRLSGAYIEETNSQRNYRILELWEGNITYEHHALRLLLILDYIFDWARDVYRKDVINSLLSLASHATASLIADTDVVSMTGDFTNPDEGEELEPATTSEETEPFSISRMLQFFDDDDKALRDARLMRHKLCALHITTDNCEDLIRSMRSRPDSQALARRLWKSIWRPNSWSVTAECLDAVEYLWTGMNREIYTFQNPQQLFLVSFSLESCINESTFFSHDKWDQIHMLSYTAIAHDALVSLRKETNHNPQFRALNIEDVPIVPTTWAMDLFRSIRLSTVKQCFGAAVTRCKLSSRYEKSYKEKPGSFPGSPNAYGHMKYFVPSFTEITDTAFAEGLPWEVYKRLKIATKEPSQSFLRFSQHYGSHENPGDGHVRPQWAIGTHDLLQLFDALVVMGECWSIQQARPYCVFFFPTTLLDLSKEFLASSDLFALPCIVRTSFSGVSKLSISDPSKLEYGSDQDFRKSLEILKHVIDQYSTVTSFDAEVIMANQTLFHEHKGRQFPTFTHTVLKWIGERYEYLSLSRTAKWSYSFVETMDGIKQEGRSLRFDQLLNNLFNIFLRAIGSQRETKDRPYPQLSMEPEDQGTESFGASSSTEGSTGVQVTLQPEVILIDSDEEDSERETTYFSSEDDSMDIEIPSFKKQRHS